MKNKTLKQLVKELEILKSKLQDEVNCIEDKTK